MRDCACCINASAQAEKTGTNPLSRVRPPIVAACNSVEVLVRDRTFSTPGNSTVPLDALVLTVQKPALNLTEFKWPLLATGAWLSLYYFYLLSQSSTRRKIKKALAKQRRDALGAEKAMEGSQSLAFLRNEPELVQHPDMIAAERSECSLSGEAR